jgi:beta-fructofuranosidase
MALHLTDKYLWDFWTIRRADEYHLFYLQAPRTPHDPDLRHGIASVGHAVSVDLSHWEVLPDALHAGSSGSWDDRAIWTGCVVERQENYYMFYTSSSRSEKGKIQHIGLAISDDLIHWERHPANPIIEADSQWYEKLDGPEVSEEAWRDPYVIYDEVSDIYYALLCARVNRGPSDGRGAVGLAQSRDLVKWEVMPPLYSSGEFTNMEVPQLININEYYFLLFSIGKRWHSAARHKRLSDKASFSWGTYTLVSDRISGGFMISNEKGLLADKIGTHYAGKIIFNPSGDPVILATRQLGENDQYLGSLSDPMPVKINTDGKLSVIKENYG